MLTKKNQKEVEKVQKKVQVNSLLEQKKRIRWKYLDYNKIKKWSQKMENL